MSYVLGFSKAPVTNFLFLLAGGSSIGSAALRLGNRFCLDHFHVFKKAQVWRLLTSQLVFTFPGEIVFGLSLIYSFRAFERQFGSRKYAASLAFFMGFSTLLQLCVLLVRPDRGSHFAAGPYSVIFGLFVQFYSEIPPTAKFRVLGCPLSDKLFTYIMGLQLVIASPESWWPSVCGLAAGAIYRMDALPFKDMRFPAWFCNACERFSSLTFGRWLGSGGGARGQLGYRRVARQDPQGRQQLFGAPAPASAANAPRRAAVEPNPAIVQTLVGMGFREDEVRRALASTNNSQDEAINLLLAQR